MKPMLASDYVEGKLRFPLIAQPKIDGVRALNIDGSLYGRSLKQHRNRFTTGYFSMMLFAGMDGELAAEHECHPELCRLTSSAVSRADGEPFVLWWVFDWVTSATKDLPYIARLNMLSDRVNRLQSMSDCNEAGRLRVIPWKACATLEDLLEYDAQNLDAGYEGTIVRDHCGMHKQGRSTVREGGLLRIKRFVEEEAVVTAIVEGEQNGNEAQTNELGNTFRTTHKANMIPNGMVGSLTCTKVSNGEVITVSPGCLDHNLRRHYFVNQHELVGKVIKFKHFPIGVKDKPRFPTFQCIRSAEDM